MIGLAEMAFDLFAFEAARGIVACAIVAPLIWYAARRRSLRVTRARDEA